MVWFLLVTLTSGSVTCIGYKIGDAVCNGASVLCLVT